MPKVAVVTPTLSHFEIPWFRIAARFSDVELTVLHMDDKGDAFYSGDYGEVINWGETLTAGYPNLYCDNHHSLRAAVKAMKPDLVLQYGYSWKGAFAILQDARSSGTPIVHRGLFTIHHDPRRNPILSRAWWGIRNQILKMYSAHHYGGEYSFQVLDKINIPLNRRYFVPYSVDTPFFDRAASAEQSSKDSVALRQRLGWRLDAPVVLFLANHAWVKGIDIFIKAVSEAQTQLPDLRVLIVGIGPLTDEMKALAATSMTANSYHFSGFVPSKMTVPYYLAADLVVFPSRLDTWGRAINEAMVCRRPCITSRWVAASGGLVQNDKNGFVLNSLDPIDYARRITEFFSLPLARRLEMANAAHARAWEFSYEAHEDELYRSLTELANR